MLMKISAMMSYDTRHDTRSACSRLNHGSETQETV
jgi:hypothetical protein